ncbi:hypothetical protein GCM10012283_18810 [Phycicoccus endophyticus]|nr:hypothetical protein GCM10012283_18810 [Phycicoccus endophyticus]
MPRSARDSVSKITEKVIEDMQAGSSRPLQRVHAAVFIDAIYVKVWDGEVGNQPFYAAIGVDLSGHRDVLGLWSGHGGAEAAKFWMGVLTDLRNRGVADMFWTLTQRAKDSGLVPSMGSIGTATTTATWHPSGHACRSSCSTARNGAPGRSWPTRPSTTPRSSTPPTPPLCAGLPHPDTVQEPNPVGLGIHPG